MRYIYPLLAQESIILILIYPPFFFKKQLIRFFYINFKSRKGSKRKVEYKIAFTAGILFSV